MFNRSKKASEADAFAKMDINAREKEWKKKLEVEEQRIGQEREDLGRYNVDAQAEVGLIEENFEETKGAVVAMLLKKVMQVDLLVPDVVVANFDKLALTS